MLISKSRDTGESNVLPSFPPHAISSHPLLESASLPLLAPVHSGADESFLDGNLASQAGLVIEPFAFPLNATALDGRLLAQVTHQYSPLQLIHSGNHCEQICFRLTSSPHAPIILGQPWLKLHNPITTGPPARLPAGALFCLQSAPPPTEGTIVTAVPEPPDLDTIPPEHHDLSEVFRK